MTVVLANRKTSGRQPFRLAPMLTRVVRSRSHRQAGRTAELLDRIVDRDLELVRALPVHLRARPVERLAALVMLAQAYRYYSAGWIGRRELRRRCQQAFRELNELATFSAEARAGVSGAWAAVSGVWAAEPQGWL